MSISPAARKWFNEQYGLNLTDEEWDELSRKAAEKHAAESQSKITPASPESLGHSSEDSAKKDESTQQTIIEPHAPKKNKPRRLKTLLLGLFGAAIAFAVWYFAYYITRSILAFSASIPLLSFVLWWPADFGLAFSVLPASTAVALGGLTARRVNRLALRIFSVSIIILYALNLVGLFIFGSFTWTSVVVSAVSIISAVVCCGEFQ